MTRSIALASAFVFSVFTPSFAGDKASPADPPTAVNATKLALSAENRSVKGLVVEKTSRGAMRAHLHGRFQHALVLRIAPDGSISMECVDSAERAAALVGVRPAASSVKTAPQQQED